MSDWGYSDNEREIIMGEISHRKRLIVEGQTDKKIFTILLKRFNKYENKLSTTKKISQDNIDIDCVQDFIQENEEFIHCNTSENGNRGKIESIHEKVKNAPKYTNLVFFVDREFREFVFTPTLQDNLNEHRVEGSLFWSRGHSIENYLFDCDVIHESLIGLTLIEYSSKTVEFFENRFHEIMCLATAVSLTLKEFGKLEELENSIDWELVDLNSSQVSLRIEDWKNRLNQRNKIDREEIEKIVISFQEWFNILKNNNVDRDTIRWICHGHIGIQIIIEVYKSCMKYIPQIIEKDNSHNLKKRNKETFQTLTDKIKKRKKEYICEDFVNWWASKAVHKECPYPQEMIEKLRSD